MNENMKDRKQKLAACYHCSSRGLMYIVGEATSNWNDCDEDEEVVYWREKQWMMLQCPSCENVSVYTEYQAFDTPLEIEYVYPQNTFEGIYSKNRLSSYHVPEKIRYTFETALKVKHIDSQLCLVSMRKTIELICKDQGVTGRSLEQLVESLTKSKKWPEAYYDICWIIRHYGNIAVHAYTKELTPNLSHVDKMMDYLYKIIEYLYIMPKQISSLKSQINIRNQPKKI